MSSQRELRCVRGLLSFTLFNTYPHSQLLVWIKKSSRGIIQKVLRDLSGKEQIMATSCQVLEAGTATGWSPSAHPLPAVACFCISASPAPVAAQASVWLQEFTPLQSRSCNQVLLSLGYCGRTWGVQEQSGSYAPKSPCSSAENLVPHLELAH